MKKKEQQKMLMNKNIKLNHNIILKSDIVMINMRNIPSISRRKVIKFQHLMLKYFSNFFVIKFERKE